MFDRIIKQIKDNNDNIFRISLYKDGIWQEETLHPVCRCLNCYSISKNFTATAIGIAQDMGMLHINDSIIKYFLDDLPANYDDKLLRKVKIKHLLNQTTGIKAGFLFEEDRYTYKEQNWIKLCLSADLEYEPGTKHIYSNSNYYLLSCLIHRVSGMTMDKFLAKYLLTPMGINEYAWEVCPMGETMGATGLYMNTTDMAKLGVLYLNKGIYEGKRLISQAWTEEAVKNQVNIPNAPWYGYSFWLNQMGYSCGGAYNQVILVIPEHNLVFAAHAFIDNYNYLGLIKNNL